MKAMYTAYTHGGNLYIVQVPPMYGLTGLMNDRKHSSTHSEILAVLYPRSITTASLFLFQMSYGF
jgi:hypothetical protein